MAELNLKIDQKRLDLAAEYTSTGIFVRAQLPNTRWVSEDIVFLTKKSLARWLRSRGGNNPWAENIVAILFGHGHFDESDYTDSE